ncbi:unnamed protein product [Lactuca saligna]|uniref:Uncharacterized protein n=1 Tax=Lactuca saligna TaxID=75948 RepID=A0AA36EJG5_LACSI|nr:unnamed protein product [Lactuca saligna]
MDKRPIWQTLFIIIMSCFDSSNLLILYSCVRQLLLIFCLLLGVCGDLQDWGYVIIDMSCYYNRGCSPAQKIHWYTKDGSSVSEVIQQTLICLTIMSKIKLYILKLTIMTRYEVAHYTTTSNKTTAFCFCWILIQLERVFEYDKTLRLWEVLQTSGQAFWIRKAESRILMLFKKTEYSMGTLAKRCIYKNERNEGFYLEKCEVHISYTLNPVNKHCLLRIFNHQGHERRRKKTCFNWFESSAEFVNGFFYVTYYSSKDKMTLRRRLRGCVTHPRSNRKGKASTHK